MRYFSALLACLVVVASAVFSGSARAEDTVCNNGQAIKMADQTWESATFTTHVVAKLLEAAFGCTVEVVPGTPAAIETALAQNDLQVIAEIWTGRSPIIEKAVAEGSVQVRGDTLAGGAEQGWYVPDYLVHGDASRDIKPLAPNLQSWQDLPQYKSLFTDPEVPDKGRFLSCPSGWVCEKTNTRLLELLGLDQDYTNFRAGTGAALDAAISSAYDQGKPILFYYWQPAGLMAKYKFHKIELPPYNDACWQTIVSGEGTLCPSDFLRAHLGVAVSEPFATHNPELIAFFEKLQFEPALLNRMILLMTEQRLSGADAASKFLHEQSNVWEAWLPTDKAHRARQQLGVTAATTSGDNWGIFPEWSGADFVNRQLMSAVKQYGSTFRAVSDWILTAVLLPVERLLQSVHPAIFLAIVALLSWHATRKIIPTLLYLVCLYAIGAVGLWDKLIQTLSLVLISTLFSIVLGIPLGIVAARNHLLRRLMVPVLDVMQTLPSFVYLIPVLMLFGLGKVPALFATIIYAVPPLIRLTILGLRQVDPNIMEAAQAFGVTRWQMLVRVSLPLARPSIMAGINQTTMMALAMVVVASMIGARGLGEDVLAGIQTLDVGRGLQAGIAIVILAIVIDRITQAYGKPRRARLQQHSPEERG